jgi:hypothetical protein
LGNGCRGTPGVPPQCNKGERGSRRRALLDGEGWRWIRGGAEAALPV